MCLHYSTKNWINVIFSCSSNKIKMQVPCPVIIRWKPQIIARTESYYINIWPGHSLFVDWSIFCNICYLPWFINSNPYRYFIVYPLPGLALTECLSLSFLLELNFSILCSRLCLNVVDTVISNILFPLPSFVTSPVVHFHPTLASTRMINKYPPELYPATISK